MTDDSAKTRRTERDWISIGELAEHARVSTRTIRYYEELGILPPPPRSTGNTRRYPPEYRFYLEGIVALKDIGFELSELVLLSRLYLGTGKQPMTATERKETRAAIRRKSDTLRRRLRVLERIQQLFEPPDAAHDGAVDADAPASWPVDLEHFDKLSE
jgi:DNA-binding transcriptional MerR regulator